MTDNISEKEIQYNIMIALMQIEGHLSDLVKQNMECDFFDQAEMDRILDGGDAYDTPGLNK